MGAALLRCAVLSIGSENKCAASAALGGVAPHSVAVLHRRNAPQKLSNVCALGGRPARSVAAANRLAMASPRLRPGVAGRARRRGRLPPRCACPPPRVVAVLASRKGQAVRCRALAFVCAAALWRCVAPFPRLAGGGWRCGASSLAAAWARSPRAGGLRVPPCLPLSLALLWSAAALGRCFALPSLSVPLALAGAAVPSLASVCAAPPFRAGLAAPLPAAASPPALAFLRAAPLLLPRRGTDARARPRSPTAFVPRRERVFCRCGGRSVAPLRRRFDRHRVYQMRWRACL